MQKTGRGRPRSNFIERRKTGIAFIDMLKKAGGVKYAEAHLGLLMYADSPHCPYCECEVAADLARSWMRRVHENTEAVFSGGDGVRGYDGRGKQRMIKDLMRPWMDDDPYPFNLDGQHTNRAWRCGFRTPQHRIVDCEVELAEFDDRAVDRWRVGRPAQTDDYSIEFEMFMGRTILSSQTRVWRYGVSREIKQHLEDARHFNAQKYLGVKAQAPWKPMPEEYPQPFASLVQEWATDKKAVRDCLESADFLERAVSVALIKWAQGACLPEEQKVAEDSLLGALETEISKVSRGFYGSQQVKAHNRKFLDDVINSSEVVRATALEISKGILLGDRPDDLKRYIGMIGDPDLYEYLHGRRLDVILRCYLEYHLYILVETFLAEVHREHVAHGPQPPSGRAETAKKEIQRKVFDLSLEFDPYQWVYNGRVLDITSPAVFKRIVAGRRRRDRDGVSVTADVGPFKQRDFVSAGPSYWPETSRTTLPRFLKMELKGRLRNWLRGRESGKVVLGGVPKGAFGENVRSTRKSVGLSQSQLSELSGVSQSAISRIERGAKSSVALDQQKALAGALGCGVKLLFEESGLAAWEGSGQGTAEAFE